MNVLVASDDREFRRLASAVLSMAGHSVRGTPVRPRRIRHLAKAFAPRVVVLDVECGSPARVRSLLADHGYAVGLVAIADDASRVPQGVPAVGRWHCASKLVKAIEVAAEASDAPEAARTAPEPPGPPTLRVVPDEAS